MKFWQSLAACIPLLCVAACSTTDPVPAATCVAGSTTPLPNPASTDFKLQEAAGATGLPGPMDLQAPPGDARLFIAEREGRICIVQNGTLLITPFLDISSRVYTTGEAGLLSFAFDPQFAANGFVYVHFIQKIVGNNGNIVVERYRVSATDPNALDPSSVAPVISIPHATFSNHYGGRVAFGPDHMLYLSTGDGGGSNNTLGNAQNATALLGKLLRLDVSSLPYTIPADNPVFPGAARNENWAIGLRNPFRYAFDGGQLYIADVGQDLFEEIDVVDASLPGLNYGWSIMEGKQCFGVPGCNMIGLTLPVYDYDHGQGCAIIGGYVYRGASIPALQGRYVFSDLCTHFVRTLSGVTVTQAPTVDVGTPLSFGQDGFGELYVLTAENRVLKFVAP